MDNHHDLNLTALFVAVVQAGSFTGAARLLNMPKSTLSHKIAGLEAHLKTQLLRRTTRRLDLTEAGQLYFSRAREMVASLQDLEHQVRAMSLEPTGSLRLTLPPSLLDLIAPVLARFLRQHPEVRIESHDMPHLVDLESRGFDFAIRACDQPPEGYSNRLLFEGPQLLVAHSSFGDRYALDELADLTALGLLHSTHWQLGDERVQPLFRYRSDNTRSIVSALEAGLGVAQISPLACARQLQGGQLVPLRDRQGRPWTGPSVRLWAVCPSRQWLTAAGRGLLERLGEYFSQMDLCPRDRHELASDGGVPPGF